MTKNRAATSNPVTAEPVARCESRYIWKGQARHRCAWNDGHRGSHSTGNGSTRWSRDDLRILILDIETFPNLVYTWGLYNQDVGASQVVEPVRIACFAAKWLGESTTHFYKGIGTPGVSGAAPGLASAARMLLHEADVVIHYNGTKFDIPHLNRVILRAGLLPPSPFKQIDLLSVVRRRFKFPSNSLKYVTHELGLGAKTPHDGFDLWVRCMAGDKAAWKLMERYNKQDVRLTEDLYGYILPWIPGHPARVAHKGPQDACPTCTRGVLVAYGSYRTPASTYRQWQCNACGAWFRSTNKTGGAGRVDIVGVV